MWRKNARLFSVFQLLNYLRCYFFSLQRWFLFYFLFLLLSPSRLPDCPFLCSSHFWTVFFYLGIFLLHGVSLLHFPILFLFIHSGLYALFFNPPLLVSSSIFFHTLLSSLAHETPPDGTSRKHVSLFLYNVLFYFHFIMCYLTKCFSLRSPVRSAAFRLFNRVVFRRFAFSLTLFSFMMTSLFYCNTFLFHSELPLLVLRIFLS